MMFVQLCHWLKSYPSHSLTWTEAFMMVAQTTSLALNGFRMFLEILVGRLFWNSKKIITQFSPRGWASNTNLQATWLLREKDLLRLWVILGENRRAYFQWLNCHVGSVALPFVWVLNHHGCKRYRFGGQIQQLPPRPHRNGLAFHQQQLFMLLSWKRWFNAVLVPLFVNSMN